METIIVLVENSEPIRRILALTLEAEGYTVHAFAPDDPPDWAAYPRDATIDGDPTGLSIAGINGVERLSKPFDVDAMLRALASVI